MVHYICMGKCGFVSYEPGVCPTENCPKHYQNLESCYCEDGSHNGKAKATEDFYKS